MRDGGLRSIFRKELHWYQWTSVETGLTAGGVPDSEFCTTNGTQGWIEFKQTKIYYVQIKPLQIAWLMRRTRMGGNAWIAVRRTNKSSDELWLMSGDQAVNLHVNGLEGTSAWCWKEGPSFWNFEEVHSILSGFKS